MFASRTLVEHSVRGMIGLGAIAAAIGFGNDTGIGPLVASLGLAAIALVAFRGCPVCWTIGMFETLRDRFKGS